MLGETSSPNFVSCLDLLNTLDINPDWNMDPNHDTAFTFEYQRRQDWSNYIIISFSVANSNNLITMRYAQKDLLPC